VVLIVTTGSRKGGRVEGSRRVTVEVATCGNPDYDGDEQPRGNGMRGDRMTGERFELFVQPG
jgi:hypothetical protein